MRITIDDLPPRYRAQAEAQIAQKNRKRKTSQQTMEEAAKTAGKIGKTFESRGEYEFYISVILPGIASGEIVEVMPHVAFSLLPEKEYCSIKLPAARYTADYVLTHSNGEVEVVEIKSKFTRRAQRDYIYRRRLFIDLIAEPKGYKFTEIITPDSKEEAKRWKSLTERFAKGVLG